MDDVVFACKLLDMAYRNYEIMAKQWHKTISTNPKTKTLGALPTEFLIHWASSIYRHLKPMYLSNQAYDEVLNYLMQSHYIDDLIAYKVPLPEAVYAVILLRREIWLYAQSQAVFFDNPIDIHQQTESINRTLLLFDYFTYILVLKYAVAFQMSVPKPEASSASHK
jgi:hypothetical protein